MRVTRRLALAIAASVLAHLLVAALVVGRSLWRAWPTAPVDVEITGMRLEDLKDLPLGAASVGGVLAEAPIAPPAATAPAQPATPLADVGEKSPNEKRKRERRAGATRADAGVAPTPVPAPPRPTSVRAYAPAGSRVTAILRVDRVRDTPYATVLDGLLLHLPDRRDLLAGTGIELYRDVDAVLIATPNPLDAAVTFLAVRHRLSDRALRAALDRGAHATGRKLDWRTERGRPFAERRSAIAGAPPSRDERLILLAAPHLVVVAPPAYRSLILAPSGRAASASRVANASSGASANTTATANANANSDGDADAGTTADAGRAGGGVAGGSDRGGDANGWAALLDRIDAEDSVLPADAVAMLSVSDLFTTRSRSDLRMGQGTRGEGGDASAPVESGGTIFGLPVPSLMTATLGIAPQPFADVAAEFATDGDAARWEQEWPALRHKLLSNPLVVLSGFSGLIGRTTLARAGADIHLRIDATEMETLRLLEIVAARLSAIGR